MDAVKLPNFMIIGAPRCGTTMVYENLKRHPEIYMSPDKEPSFFALEGEESPFQGPGDDQKVRSWATYCMLFGGVKNQKSIGEASTLYLYSPQAPSRIRDRLPSVKLIALLRQPVDRAYSHFLRHRLDGREPLADFGAALAAEESRKQKGWSPFWYYREVGFYGRQIARYLKIFDQSQMLFFLYDDLQSDPAAVLKKIFQFLEVDPAFPIRGSLKHAPAGAPKNKALHVFLTKPNLIKHLLKQLLPKDLQQALHLRFLDRNLTKPTLGNEIRRALLSNYREDILQTQEFLHRDLSSWLG